MFLLLWTTLAFGAYQPDVQKFVNQFIVDSNLRVLQSDFDNVEIVLRPLGHRGKAKLLGLCEWRLFGNRISLDEYYWYNMPEVGQWGLIYHEFGHCICNLYHDDTTLMVDNCPADIMHSTSMHYDCFHKHRKQYIARLFSKCKVYREPEQIMCTIGGDE